MVTWCNQNQNAKPFCEVPIFERTLLQCDRLASRHEKGLVSLSDFFSRLSLGAAGFPSHVEVFIFGILPNSTVANPQTIAGSQWKIRLCRENHYQFQILGCLLYLLFECCLHIYIYFISILVRNCWSVFYHDAVKFWTFNPNTEPQQLGSCWPTSCGAANVAKIPTWFWFLGLPKRMGRYEVWICLDFVFLAI